MPGRRRHVGVPSRLTIVVGVDVHPAGRYQQPVSVDLAFACAQFFTNLDDLSASDGDISGLARRLGSIDDSATANDEVIHENQSPS